MFFSSKAFIRLFFLRSGEIAGAADWHDRTSEGLAGAKSGFRIWRWERCRKMLLQNRQAFATARLPRITQMHKVRSFSKMTGLCQSDWSFPTSFSPDFGSGDPMTIPKVFLFVGVIIWDD